MRFPDKPLEPMLDKIKLLDDLRPQQSHEIAGTAEVEAGKEFFGHSGSTDYVSFFNHCDLLPFLGQVSGRYQPIMASADDQSIILLLLELFWSTYKWLC